MSIRNPIFEARMKFQASMMKSVAKCKVKHGVSRCDLCGDTLHCYIQKYEAKP